ncbi:MMPL family transporter [Streptomyces sp. NPDC056056]|uniref:MMPL family transporter n=1 Tax=Streptomyces sp. NPDC056056 TaxID=3345698 RepID=UPI0035DFA725
MRRKPATVRIARWSATHPWSAIGLWVVFVALCLLLGGAAGTQRISDAESGVGESGRAGRITASGHFTEKPEENVLITAAGGRLDTATERKAAAELAGRMRALPEVESVGSVLPSPDGTALLLPVTMRGDTENADTRVQQLLDASAATERAHEGVRIDQIGTGSTAKGLGETLGEDFRKAELISLPLTLLILLVVFGAIIAAGVPVLLALSCVGAAIGLSALASHVLPETSAVSNVILLMGMAVGVDYSLFHLKREREERRKGASHLDAIEIAAETSGHTVVVSGTTVIVSMAGLYLAQEATFASLATGSIIVVAVAVLASLTVLPALLAKLGRWVDRPRAPFLWRLTLRSSSGSRLWPALLRPALVRPALTLTVSVGALLLLALPALDLRLKQPGSDDLSRDIPVVRAMDRLTAAFPGKGTVHQVAVRAPAERADEVEAALRSLLNRAEGQRLFAHDLAPAIRASADRRVHTVAVGTPHSPRSDGARASLALLRAWVPEALAPVRGAEGAVGGKVAQGVDFTGHLKERMPWVVGFVLLLTFVTMAAIFRSLAVALSAILLNLLSAAASFGVLVAVFQHTWAEGLLDFHSSGAVVSWLPLFLFVVLFGLSMDYHVFVVSRIREAALDGAGVRDAVREGITRSAGVVTGAAIVMVAVFAVFGTLSMVEFKQLGVGLAAAILLDAVVIRIFVLPALMTALGRWNWWPGGLGPASRGRHAARSDADRPPRPPVQVGAPAGNHRR